LWSKKRDGWSSFSDDCCSENDLMVEFCMNILPFFTDEEVRESFVVFVVSV